MASALLWQPQVSNMDRCWDVCGSHTTISVPHVTNQTSADQRLMLPDPVVSNSEGD